MKYEADIKNLNRVDFTKKKKKKKIDHQDKWQVI